MNFELTEEQKMVRQMVREFAESEIMPIADKMDEEEIFPEETVKKMGELGLMGMEIPQEFGGAGVDTISYIIAVEELSRVSPAHGVIMSVNNSLACYGIDKYGTERQKREILTPLAKGQTLGAFALTEPHTGSDASNLLTFADRKNDEYIISGRKVWVTNGPKAGYVVLFAVTDREKGHRGITAFIVDMKKPGVILGKPEKKLGIRAAYSGEIVLEEYRASESDRLGNENEGFKVAMSILDKGRIGIAGQSLGIAQAALEMSIKYGSERKAFGKPIIEHQAISFYISEMKTRLEAARLLTYNAAWIAERKARYSLEAAMAKLYASEVAMWATTKAIQIHGSMGYSREHPIQRFFRDAKVTEIYEGTSEIQRLVIARETLKKFSHLVDKE